jgi:transposase-like protein
VLGAEGGSSGSVLRTEHMKQKFTPEKIERARALFATGLITVVELSLAFGVSNTLVRRHLFQKDMDRYLEQEKTQKRKDYLKNYRKKYYHEKSKPKLVKQREEKKEQLVRRAREMGLI